MMLQYFLFFYSTVRALHLTLVSSKRPDFHNTITRSCSRLGQMIMLDTMEQDL